MKKIFAIALAVVMVLSMASAFAASECYTWGTNWSCAPDNLYCGKAKVEVVPYVKVNTSCGMEYQVSDCAAAIRTENVYFAVKLTVDAYPDPQWVAEAMVDFETNGVVVEGFAAEWEYDDTNARTLLAGIDMNADEEKVYYLTKTWGWADSSAKGFEIDPVVWKAEVLNELYCDADGFGVCAKLTSFYDGATKDAYNVVGDYKYRFFDANDQLFTAWADEDDKYEEFDGTFYVWDKDDFDDRVWFTVVDGSITKAEWTDDDFYNKVMADFGLTACGTAACITENNILANFGWDFEQESCFDWSEKGAAVVDTDCVVAIPKTGDASVLAWLF